MKISVYIAFIIAMVYGQTIFGMEALAMKQQQVADDTLSQAQMMRAEQERKEEQKQQAEEEGLKKDQEERERVKKEREQRIAEEATEQLKKCKPMKKAGEEKIPGTKDLLTVTWIIKASYGDFYSLFRVNPALDNKTLATDESRQSLKERLGSLMNHFDTQKQSAEGACSQDVIDAVDWAKEKIQGFYDFLIDVRAADLKGDALKSKIMKHQNAWFEGKTAMDAGAKGEALRQATNTQRDMAFRADLIKEYAKNTNIKITIKPQNFMTEFDITDKSTGMSSNLHVDVRTLQAEVGDVQSGIKMAIESKTLTNERKAELKVALTLKETKVRAALDKYSGEDDQAALQVLLIQISALRTKLDAYK